MYSYSWNVSADEAAIAQGPDYYEGAVEYYNKILKRNAALHQLLGSVGRKKFTPEGEMKGLFSSVPSFQKRLKLIYELKPEEEEEESVSHQFDEN